MQTEPVSTVACRHIRHWSSVNQVQFIRLFMTHEHLLWLNMKASDIIGGGS